VLIGLLYLVFNLLQFLKLAIFVPPFARIHWATINKCELYSMYTGMFAPLLLSLIAEHTENVREILDATPNDFISVHLRVDSESRV